MLHSLRLALPFVSLVLLGSGAHAMMAPEHYRRARAEAPYHLQVAIDKVTPPAEGPGDCRVEGTVVEVFKDTEGKLPVGTPLSFGVACYRPGDRMPVGGTVWTQVAALESAKYIEVYLVDDGPGFSITLSNSRIIDAPSKQPQFPVE
jgi:hypothetical protein